jgi:hypothetical protein
MHPIGPYISQIYHHLSNKRRPKTIHDGFHLDREISGFMAIKKGFSQMNSTLVEALGKL